MQLSNERIKEFANYLCWEEKSAATQEKYLLEGSQARYFHTTCESSLPVYFIVLKRT